MRATHAAGLAMPVAGLMIAHQVAGKAVRDAAFLSAWPVSHLPAMVMATAFVAVAAVPVYSRLFERFGPGRVVSLGFVISAAAHVAEWFFSSGGGWVAVAVYLHIAGLSGLLLSGFWSVMSERFDVQAARIAYGRIAAAGTLGGLAGGLTVARMAETLPPSSSFLLLAGLHAACALGVALLRDTTTPLSAPTSPAPGVFHLSVLRGTPHLKTLALIVIAGTAAAAIADYLLKMHAVERISTGAGLLQFFATFYVAVQVLTFLAQFAVGAVVRRFGLGATISALPSGVAGIGSLSLLYPGFPLFITLRGFEAVLRGSIFRSAYELIFVPMDPVEKRRTKTFLDVTCDRAGDAVGAGIVQLILLTGATFLSSQLVAAIIALSAAGVWLGRRLDALYLGVVERRLTTHRRAAPVLAPSETGWTVLELSHLVRPEAPPAAETPPPAPAPPSTRDTILSSLAELRSGDRARVGRALKQISAPCPITVGQIIQLLAWNDMVPDARVVLERIGAAHIGALSDALLSPGTDFAIRRRIPRVLGALADPRAMNGLLAGLDDERFEVRYQCSRALRRLLARSPDLASTVDRARVLAVVAREVSAPLSIWRGYRLIDSVEQDDATSAVDPASDHDQRSLEHVSFLLSAVLPAGPLEAAMQGIRSDDADLRSVAIEYLEGVLPPAVWANLRRLIDATPTASADDAPGQSGPPPPATPA